VFRRRTAVLASTLYDISTLGPPPQRRSAAPENVRKPILLSIFSAS
jgi:hypothetical protein